MKILVTGGLGFIGHNVVRLLEQDHEVTIIDSQTDYNLIPQDELRYLFAERKKKIKSTYHTVDIRDKEEVSKIFSATPFDIVIHLASFPRQKTVSLNPITAADVMMTGLINILTQASKSNVYKFVYVSSSMVYGNFESGVTELARCTPVGQYGIMKYAGEQLTIDAARNSKMTFSIVRPSAVYGPNDVEDRVVSKFILSALRDQSLTVKGPTEVLDFTYVSDIAKGIALVSTSDIANGQTYNITRSDDTLHTLLDAANLAVELVGKGKVEVTSKDFSFPDRGRLSIDKAIRDLGYLPQVSIREGFQNYIDWFRSSEFWKNKI